MRKKQLLLIAVTLLCALILSSSSAFANGGGQQVKIPYVVSMESAGWWTGIAITNNSSSEITDMKLAFTKDNGANGWYMPPFIMSPPPSERSALPGPFIPYETDLDTIEGNAILSGTLAALYAGEGTKNLPSDIGSVILYHTGSESFTVTVSIGNDNGFAYYVFESEGP